ncbi:MAG: hypothetical protein M5U26_19700 [Planctomycetota bacterium]|nr:hypothetical protein [Planctomycetota bacterium]
MGGSRFGRFWRSGNGDGFGNRRRRPAGDVSLGILLCHCRFNNRRLDDRHLDLARRGAGHHRLRHLLALDGDAGSLQRRRDLPSLPLADDDGGANARIGQPLGVVPGFVEATQDQDVAFAVLEAVSGMTEQIRNDDVIEGRRDVRREQAQRRLHQVAADGGGAVDADGEHVHDGAALVVRGQDDDVGELVPL